MTDSRLIVSNRDEIPREEWDACVDASDEAWLWHRFDFQDALSTWPGMHDLSFAIRDSGAGGQLVSVIPLKLVEKWAGGLFRSRVLDSFGGPACRNDLPAAHKRKVVEQALARILSLAARYHVVETNLSLTPMAPAFRSPSCPRTNPLLDLGCENTLTQTWVLDLRQTPESIRAGYSELTRRELRKAHTMPWEVREASGPADLAAYYDLHCETYHRTGVRPHPIEYFRAIFEIFVPARLSRIVLLMDNGRLLAAQNTALYKKAGAYWTGASRSDRQGGENRLLFDEQILHGARHGFEWYETGEAFPNLRRGKLKGLNDFKRTFGGGLYPYYRGRLIVRRRLGAVLAGYRVLRDHR